MENRDPASLNQSPISGAQGSIASLQGLSANQRQRDILEQIKENNPLKSNNVSNLVMSPGGNRFLVAYENEQLKFWKFFNESNSGGNFSRFSGFSDWR